MAQPAFQSHYIPNTPEDQQAMLRAIGMESIDALFADIPSEHRNPPLQLPPPLPEMELRQEMEALAARNLSLDSRPSFLGAGCYHHFIPSVVRAILSRGEFLTSYTPYQAEVSQGTLQAAYEFQSLVCHLYGMEVANAGMYDGATSLAEAALMACRLAGRFRVAALDTVPPTYRQVVDTYTRPQGVEVVSVHAGDKQLPKDTACLLVQSPNFFGYIEDMATLSELAHGAGALFVVSADPVSLGMFRAPGEFGADIATGEGQPLGIAPSFGGPYVGLFTCRQTHIRQMPGRVVGRTVDRDGRPAYVLTLQTREQHIRRERATSNICTSEALMALAATVYLAVMGPQGLRQVAELCYQKAHYAAAVVSKLRGYSLPIKGAFFQEFVVRCPVPPAEVNRRLLERGIIGGLDVSDRAPNGMLLCVTEMNTRQEIDALAAALAEVGR
ncbi:MAG: aminomethyl-transferring glycine dehydrogenase subunit GcvPA [Chloroflexota bacterium]|nr:aminomethyl-transferring glycine dehydrogenase subunit GcvPA [Chloroflexota bacterium]